MNTPSESEAINFGQNNAESVRDAFERDMFQPWIYNWIWNSAENEFGVRDLGYYVGYAIAEKYYEAADDKSAAVKTFIELDYESKEEVWAIVEASGYFSAPLSDLESTFNGRRPIVLDHSFSTLEIPNDVGEVVMTVRFSEPMDTHFRSTDFGALGKAGFPTIKDIQFDAQGLNATYVLGVERGKTYQMKIDLGYRTPEDMPLIPELIEFTIH